MHCGARLDAVSKADPPEVRASGVGPRQQRQPHYAAVPWTDRPVAPPILAGCRQVEVLLLKLLCAPALVVASSLAGRRWGDAVAGVLVALPIVAGPILFITDVQHGSSFAARAATASLLGLISLAFFTVIFVFISRRTGWALTIFACWVATLGADVGLSSVHVTATAALALTVAATTLAISLTQRAAAPAAPSTTAGWPWWDLPGRALATAALVVTITSASSAFGPTGPASWPPFPSPPLSWPRSYCPDGA